MPKRKIQGLSNRSVMCIVTLATLGFIAGGIIGGVCAIIIPVSIMNSKVCPRAGEALLDEAGPLKCYPDSAAMTKINGIQEPRACEKAITNITINGCNSTEQQQVREAGLNVINGYFPELETARIAGTVATGVAGLAMAALAATTFQSCEKKRYHSLEQTPLLPTSNTEPLSLN